MTYDRKQSRQGRNKEFTQVSTRRIRPPHIERDQREQAEVLCVFCCCWCCCFTSSQHQWSYQDGYQFVTVCTHGNFIMLPHWDVSCYPTQSHYPDTEPTSIVIMPSARLGSGMCCPVFGKVHIKDPYLLIGKSSLCGDNGFPLKKYVSMTICLTSNSRWYEHQCALEVSLNKTNFQSLNVFVKY